MAKKLPSRMIKSVKTGVFKKYAEHLRINEFLANIEGFNDVTYRCRALSDDYISNCKQPYFGKECDKEDCDYYKNVTTDYDYTTYIHLSTHLAIAKGFRIEVYVGKESVGVKIGSENLNVLTKDFENVNSAEAYARALVLYKCLGGEE